MEKIFRKYIALTILIIFGLSLLYLLRDYLAAIFAAIILAYFCYPIFNKINLKTKKPNLSASITIVFVLLLILIPISALAGSLLSQVNNLDFNENRILKYESSIENLTGVSISISSIITEMKDWLKSEFTSTLPKIVSVTSSFLLFIFIMLFIMFFLFVEKEDAIKTFKSYMPFSSSSSDYFLKNSANYIKAIVIGQVLTAIIQGTLGMISFFIVGLNGALLWGIIMIILSVIPLVGAFIIWIPAGLFLLIEGQIWQGIFVLVWGAVIVSQVDNIIRPYLVNRFADIHPVDTLLGVFIGLPVFGLIGVIIGPLIIAMFKLLVNVYRKEYDNNSVK